MHLESLQHGIELCDLMVNNPHVAVHHAYAPQQLCYRRSAAAEREKILFSVVQQASRLAVSSLVELWEGSRNAEGSEPRVHASLAMLR